ncbi:hypothetical protein [Mesorhizobium sp. B2-8-3]|uniref:hypothetical protein n=1 Tax=Mesorhizobium sp. B2-8-3 TaxID=2589905 RepID=UPI00112E47B6|nr:hypothetical protein [Mesorhizobium sp. B2-8-3]TPJ33690.1 hypothetical protein FJ418_13760 [Mesorhizobium sp. B2-8-3]
MTLAFDTLGYSKHLREAGVKPAEADAHAEAARDYIMPQIATKADIAELKHLIERQTLSLTVRLGTMLGLGLAIIAGLQKFLQP